MMAHDWGVIVPESLTTEQVFEIRDKLRCGRFVAELSPDIADHPKAAIWQKEINDQMLAAYDAEASRRRC